MSQGKEDLQAAAPRTTAITCHWVVRLTCCERDDGIYEVGTWAEADSFRDSYLNADGHRRSAIITETACEEPPRKALEVPAPSDSKE